MPWGDSRYVSRNFVQHCTLRHRFEYGTFVEYGEDDDAVMRRVLEESAREAGVEVGAAGQGGHAGGDDDSSSEDEDGRGGGGGGDDSSS
jgi:hypothetical protein